MQARIQQILNSLSIENSEYYSRFLIKWSFIGLMIHLVAAFFSAGFHHYDEHWQILEFMSAHLGKTPFQELPWEYTHRMRSWAQPGIYYFLAKILNIFDINNPFTLATIFRIFSSLLGWLSILVLSVISLIVFQKNNEKTWAIRLLNLLYFIPFIHARASSEGMSSSFYVLGLGLLIISSHLEKANKKLFRGQALVIGCIMGCSFLFRFQMGFSILFSWIWYCIWGSKLIKYKIMLAAGVVIAMLLEVPIDYWGHGEVTFAPWNYLNQNLIQGKASTFYTSPWYDYIEKALIKGIPPISILIVGSWLLFWVKKWKSPLTWGTFPMFLVHTLIPAKALRYLFPIAPLSPLILIGCASLFSNKFLTRIKPFLLFCFYLNFILLIGVCLLPARTSVLLYKYIYQHSHKIKEVYYSGNNPYELVGLPIHFYRPEKLSLKKITDFSAIPLPAWIITKRGSQFLALKNRSNCKIAYSIYPNFIINTLEKKKWFKKTKVWSLFKCSK